MDARIILAVLFSLIQCQVCSQMITKSNKSCSGITINIQSLQNGLSSESIRPMLLKKPTKGDSSAMCQAKWTCCSEQLEKRLYNVSSGLLKDALRSKMNSTQKFFEEQASLFNDFFQLFLKRAKVNWHKLLFATYKNTYSANRQMFDVFFSSLERYTAGSNVILINATDTFFKRMFSKILVLMQPKLKTNQDFLNCATRNIYKIKPFGSRQTQISSQLVSSLQIARAFTDSLAVGSAVAKSLSHDLPTSSCLKSFARIQHCSMCAGLNVPTCKKTCENALQECLPNTPEIQRKWNDFIKLLQLMSETMQGVYNFEVAAGQLGYDISLAIMHLQSNMGDAMMKASSFCQTSRKRRAAPSGTDFYLEGDGRRKRSSGPTLPRHFGLFPNNSAKPTNQLKSVRLRSLTSAFKKQLSKAKNIWTDLPMQICDDQRFASQVLAESCWNGLGVQLNFQRVPIPKSRNNVTDAMAIVESQLQLLVYTSTKNKEAIGGKVFVLADDDNDDDDDDHQSSGSGEASGDSSGDSSGSHVTTPTDNIKIKTTFTPVSVKTTSVHQVTTGEGDNHSGSGDSSPTTNVPTDDEDYGNQSGSGSGSGSNEIPQVSKNDSKPTGNLVGNPPTPSQATVHVYARKNPTDDPTLPNGGSRSWFLPTVSVTLLCLLVSVFLLQ